MRCVECIFLARQAESRKKIPPPIAEAQENSNFCGPHQPQVGESQVRYYGYYLARKDMLVGAEGVALGARDRYLYLGLNPKYAGPYDGVSISWDYEGKRTVRVTLQNFFDEKINIMSRDID